MYKIFTVCLTLVLLSACSEHAEHSEALQKSEDRAEIEHLLWRYARALDTLDEDAYASVFTEDGQFISSNMASSEKGHEALKQVILGVKEGRAQRIADGGAPSQPMHHMIVNHHIEFIDADHAEYHAYWMTVFEGSGTDIPVNVAAAGRSVDELVRVDGEWLIKSRNVSPQD